ncbi:MAG TPA: Gfo/Idh/MocA family oxidoreductase [Chitinophagaceae bacterium]|nr:Gfo/Idh/MocA family oxidoreductase [Chitinophagaceae bacterium]
MDKLNWGIIGCGDVTEVKSGPAFNKVPHSSLVAVMRRDEEKLKDYARRHHVPVCHTDAFALIHDPQVNAVYIATPPSSHAAYTIAALEAGKPVYVEKPMAMNAAEAAVMQQVATKHNVKLAVAHYRRAQPLFQHIKNLLEANAIGTVRTVQLSLYKNVLKPDELVIPKTAWRVNAAVSGGGLFHDLAPHQLDILYYYFGEAKKVNGIAVNQAGAYTAADMVAGTILFEKNILFTGQWCFSLEAGAETDTCEITGTKGRIRFSFFEQLPVELTTAQGNELINFEPLLHVQQPMIEKVCRYFRGEEDNPCSGGEGVTVMQWMESIAG